VEGKHGEAWDCEPRRWRRPSVDLRSVCGGHVRSRPSPIQTSFYLGLNGVMMRPMLQALHVPFEAGHRDEALAVMRAKLPSGAKMKMLLPVYAQEGGDTRDGIRVMKYFSVRH